VPDLPGGFVDRDEFGGLRELVLGVRSGAAGIAGEPLGLHGEGGIGKTVLASALARDEEVRAHFPDGVFWVTVGERPDLVASQIELLRRLGAEPGGLRAPSDGRDRLCEVLADHRVLLVFDDLWSDAAARAFRVVGPAGRGCPRRVTPSARGVGASCSRSACFLSIPRGGCWPISPVTACCPRGPTKFAAPWMIGGDSGAGLAA
jgi:hypothetical protein